MAEKQSSLSEIKKAIIGVITLAITTAGGLFIANMEKIFDGKDEVKQEVSTNLEAAESKVDTLVIIKEEKPVAQPASPDKKKEFDW